MSFHDSDFRGSFSVSPRPNQKEALMHRTDDDADRDASIASVSANAPVMPEASAGMDAEGSDASDGAADGIGRPMSNRFRPTPSDVVNVLRGFCMGAADTVPGVSGGTIALILGHYQRLVTAISHIDAELIRLVSQRRFRAAADHIDLRFMVALVTGILVGVGTLAGVMHWLLDHRMPETLSVFLGLLIASVWVVHRYIDRWTISRYVTFAIGVIVALGITALPMGQGGTSLPFLFGAAMVAICAMILPGISGAFVLLLLGAYHTVTGLIKDFVKLNLSSELLLQLVAFGSGCVVGLLAFSRLLRWLLEHYRGATMAWLMGLMVGSIRKLWPLQIPTPETADLEMKHREMQYVSPSDWSGGLWHLIALAAVAFVAVLVLERLAETFEASHE